MKRIGNKTIGEGASFIVLEAGPTHEGLESAKELAHVAKEAGADAVKFQMIFPDRLMADKSVMFDYKYLEIDGKGNERFVPHQEPLYDILKRRELSYREWKALKAYCDELGITMFTTATFPDEVDFIVDELQVDSIKVNSSDVNEYEFLRYCAQKGVNVQLDTGNADIWEIEKAVQEIERTGNADIIIHHCPSGYPAHVESIHLNMIPTLKRIFPEYGIAFSDHSPGWNMDIAAIALGAEMVEKTITLDRTIKSCEHSFSLEPQDAKDFVASVRELERALGDQRRTIPQEEREKRKKGRRSPYALKDLQEGEQVRKEDFEFKRPGYGVTSEEFAYFEGKTLTRGIQKGEAIGYEHI